jgi:RNA 2',3'-cyclic 3'-phosphodiesterase
MSDEAQAHRLFVGIDLPVACKTAMRALQDALRPGVPGVRWVRGDAFHLTLKFLGAVSPQQVPAVSTVLTETSAGFASGGLRIAGLEAAPNFRRARVLWLACEVEPAVVALQAELELRLSQAGFSVEARPFKPHLTLGRLGRPGSSVRRDWALACFAQVEIPARVPFQEIVLFRSILGAGGSRYERMAVFPLRG